MTLENLARIGKLKAHAADEREIARLLESADRALRDASVAGLSSDSCLDLAYRALMQAALAAVMANGYRQDETRGTALRPVRDGPDSRVGDSREPIAALYFAAIQAGLDRNYARMERICAGIIDWTSGYLSPITVTTMLRACGACRCS